MDDNPGFASNWKGRVLMQVCCEETDKPVCKVARIPDDCIDDAKTHLKDRSFEFIAEIGQAIALPDSKKYTLKLIIGGKEFQTGQPRSSKKNYSRFDERIGPTSLSVPYKDIDDFGFVILHLMDEKDDPVCYYKDHISNYTEKNAAWKWVSLIPDLSIGKVKNPNEAGMISFKLSIRDITKNDKSDFME